MTDTTVLTRCPHCDTRFRVTDEQLGIARGKVRCGSCMEVFNALDNQEAETPETTPAGKAPTPQDSEPEPEDTSLAGEDDFVFQDNPEEDAVAGRYAGTKSTFSDDELSDSFRAFDEKAPGGFGDDTDDEQLNESVDESWAEAMLSEERPRAREPERPVSTTVSPEPEPKPAPKPETPPEPATEPHSLTAAEPEVPSFDMAPERGREDDDAGWNLPPEPALAAERPGADTYHNLRHEPIEVSGSGSGSWLRKTVWTLIVLALVGLLVSQLAYFQFDRLSTLPQLRPFYEQACELAGCELEPLVAIDQIQSRKLVVRTAPDDRNSLIVDAVIINEAEFAQPFPAIGLTFSNLNGDVVAQSLFAPEDYLAGEALEMDAMPPQTPVRIAINIRDPGRDAVNYNISFLPRQP